MKNHYTFSLFLVLASFTLNAQIGIGTSTPDPSSLIDLYSENKGMLIPRLTSIQRDQIVLPATGLMIYNMTTHDGEMNNGTPLLPAWSGMKNAAATGQAITSITENGVMSTTSNGNIMVPGMSISPLAGTYLLLFNGQMSTIGTTFSSAQGSLDVNLLYNTLINLPPDQTHGLVFGNGEVLLPGIYDVNGATSIAATLKLDGGGNPNALFVIRSSGAFTTGTAVTVELMNGASANNIFWVAEGAISTGAGTTLQGTLVAHALAVSLGANTNLVGRMFTTAGAITMGAASYLAAPAGASPFPLGVLSTFVMYTPAGAISGCSDCGIVGDVGTGAGAATSFDSIAGTVYLPGTTSTPIASIITYSIYLGENEILNSSRTFNSPNSSVSLQSMISVANGESVEIRWKVDNNQAIITQRTLSLIRSN